ncbi:4Fe-4S binding protein [Dehalococcoides mccartyi]|uniref:4Fe-4S binding protein n=1 Tax=Dehalococcoides mccartyi TaxID=61435 RepID=UPI0003C85EB2|nr:4Fe-4S binding protein [Dehalococcoides mccartyi]AHB13669.1 ferredoxin-type protein NapH [Dehalococcoides mccartyi GY50]
MFKNPFKHLSAAIAGFFLAVTILLSTPNPILACDISILPAVPSGASGSEISLTVNVALTHRVCTVPISQTDITLTNMTLVSQTDWNKINNSLYQATLIVKLGNSGTGTITVVRECTKGGDTASVKITIQSASADVSVALPSDTIPAVTDPPDENLIPTILPADIINTQTNTPAEQELGWMEAIYQALSEPYMLAYIALMSAGTISFLKGWRKNRPILMAVSLFYLGFFVGGCPCAIGSLQSVLLHTGEMKIYMVQYILLFIPVITTLFWGRIFCGWVCPMGALQNFIYRKETGIKINEKLNHYLSFIKYIFLFALIAAVLITGTTVFAHIDPFKALFNFDFNWFTGIFLGLVLTGSIFISGFWCRYLCPLGAFLGLLSKLSYFKLKFGTSCKHCGICQKTYCEYGVINGSGKELKLDNSECVRCGECLKRCPKNAVKLSHNRVILISGIPNPVSQEIISKEEFKPDLLKSPSFGSEP